MKLTLLCERCNIRGVETQVGVFDYLELTWPLDPGIFKSWNPDLLPDPFPALVDSWDVARCRICGARPFLNMVPQQNGTVMIVTGDRVAQGLEGQLLTLEQGLVPIPGYPNAPKPVIDKDGNIGIVVSTTDKEPPKTQNGPVTCSDCGKEYVTQANLDRYHKCKGVNDGQTGPNTTERGTSP
jgi:hypothetical protein